MESPHQLGYATASPTTCPLCEKRPIWKKTIYGHPVCKKCFYGFANRRQLGYLIDAILWIAVAYAIGDVAGRLMAGQITSDVQEFVFFTALGLVVACLFITKDGFSGYSPGKRITGVRVLHEETNEPISFGRSFRRNSILLLGQIPFVGAIVGLVIILVIAYQCGRGYRVGDRFAGTRVIWDRYANNPVFSGTDRLCPKCGYDLSGNTSGTCPECGTPVVGEADYAPPEEVEAAKA